MGGNLASGFGAAARLIEFGANVDERGRLVELDFELVPFSVRRAFTVADVPAGAVRGGHSHRDVEQLLSCVSGRIEVELRIGDTRSVVELTPSSGALHIGPGVWARQRYAEPSSVLLVLASEPFDPSSYEAEH